MTEAAAIELVTEAEYARLRGVSRQTVNEYKSHGQLVMDGSLVDVVASDDLLANVQNPMLSGAGSKSTDGASLLFQAKTREAQARAVERELRARALAGEYLDRQATSDSVFAIARSAQESMLAIADRLAPGLAGESDPAQIHKILSDELRAVCQMIAADARGLS